MGYRRVISFENFAITRLIFLCLLEVTHTDSAVKHRGLAFWFVVEVNYVANDENPPRLGVGR